MLTGCLLFFFHSVRERLDSKPIPVYGQISPFEFTDSQGQVFHSKEKLLGSVSVVSFFFSRCKGICPLLHKEMAQLQDLFKGSSQFQLVSLTVDPEHDQPSVLNKLAARLKADPKRWHFLTGPLKVIERVMTNEFKIGFANQPIYHSDRFVLLDKFSRVRGYYSLEDRAALSQMKKDIATLLRSP